MQENRIKAIEEIAEESHKRLVEYRKIKDPKPYVKTTTDMDWVKAHGTDQVNLSNSAYVDLPSDWKKERIAGAIIAYEKVSEQIQLEKKCDENFVEEVANLLHEKWLERNNQRASVEQKNRYVDMSEYEKEKDRIFVKVAIEVMLK